MKIEILITITILLFTSEDENSIIKIPNVKQKIIKNIKTKNGLIEYGFETIIEDTGLCVPSIFSQCHLSKMKNLNLFELPKKTAFKEYIIEGKKKDILNIKLEKNINDECNPLICEVFYKTKYIDKLVYSIAKNEYNESYKYFGGTPKNLLKNLNKFSLNNKTEKISEINIKLNNGKNKNIKLNLEESSFEINEGKDEIICFPEKILKEIQKLVFNKYNRAIFYYDLYFGTYIYSLLHEQINTFPEISFKIGNKIFTLNKDNAFLKGKNETHYFLFINNYSCNKFIFGLEFLELFDIREFNLENQEIYLYLDKNKNYLIEEKENKKNILNSKLNIYIFFSFIIGVIIFSLKKIYHKKKRIEFYNHYFDIFN